MSINVCNEEDCRIYYYSSEKLKTCFGSRKKERQRETRKRTKRVGEKSGSEAAHGNPGLTPAVVACLPASTALARGSGGVSST